MKLIGATNNKEINWGGWCLMVDDQDLAVMVAVRCPSSKLSSSSLTKISDFTSGA
jgi:hypothetical protein